MTLISLIVRRLQIADCLKYVFLLIVLCTALHCLSRFIHLILIFFPTYSDFPSAITAFTFFSSPVPPQRSL